MSFSALLLAALLAASPPDRADQELAAYDRGVLAEVQRIAPRAVEDARVAGDAYRAGRWSDAIAGYERVLAAAPGFPHALRRICTARHALGDRAAALPLCRQAVARSATADNQMALARALATVPAGAVEPSAADRAEAVRLAGVALSSSATDTARAQAACLVATATDDVSLLRRCADQLGQVAPGEAMTEYFLALASGSDGALGDARAHLRRAAAAGLDAKVVAGLEAAIDAAEPPHVRYGIPALKVGAVWLAGLLLLVSAGVLLSRATLGAAARLARAAHGTTSRASRALRAVYGAVLWATCAYYYLSLPLVLLAVFGLGAGVLYGFMALGQIPVKLVVLLAIAVIVTAWAVLKSLWVALVRPRDDGDPGLRLDPAREPGFAGFVARVAARIGTRPVDAVFLTPGTEVAVYEQGGLARQLTGRSERCLVLGVGVLDGMHRGELAAVLAHEYGHLVNRDTAGGGLALAVRRSVLTMARALAEGGAAAWYNPAWWFVQGFHRVFLRVSQGASRLQEILADRWAALAYGGRTFARGLEHVVARSVRFDAHTQRALREVIEGERALANLYAYAPESPPEPAEVERAVAEALSAEPSPYDSHPCPRDRIAWASPVEATQATEPDADEPAWGLFADRAALEREMTGRVREAVAANHGVIIPESADGPAAAAG